MTQDHRTSIWTYLGLLVGAYAINAFLLNARAKTVLAVPLLDDRQMSNAYFSIILLSVGLVLLLTVGRRYAEVSMMPRGVGRLPVVALQGLNTASTEGRRFQWFFLILFVVVPFCVLVLLWTSFISTGQIVSDDKVKGGRVERSITLRDRCGFLEAALLSPFDGRRYCIIRNDVLEVLPEDVSACSRARFTKIKNWRGEDLEVEGGVDWMGFVSAFLLIGSTGLVFVQGGRFVLALRAPSSNDGSG